jgi:hypothetical protein
MIRGKKKLCEEEKRQVLFGMYVSCFEFLDYQASCCQNYVAPMT